MLERAKSAQWTELTCLADAAGEIRIDVNEQRTLAVMSVTRGPGSARPKAESIQRLLREKGISKHVVRDEIDAALRRLQRPFARVSGAVVARGVAPVNGVDGRLVSVVEGRLARVSVGDCLAKLYPPQAGQDGEDVFGKTLPAVQGLALKLQLGTRVCLDDAGQSVTALADGFPVVLGAYVDIWPRYAISVAADRLRVSLSFDDTAATAEELTTLLQEAGVCFGLRGAELSKAIQDGRATDLQVAAGIKPMSGTQARLEYFFALKGGDLDNPAGEDRSEKCNPLAMFDAGAMLLRLQPAKQGAGGIDVFGLPIPVDDQVEIEISAGENVEKRRVGDAYVYTATQRGTPFLEAGVLRVSDEYIINADLTPAYGNIEYEGSVRIQGDVPNGYRVASEKDITISGVVNESQILSGQNINIDSGCMGAGTARLVTGGDLSAKYIDHAQVQSHGDVCVANEVIASKVECLGTARFSKAVVRGGDICALGGVEIGVLGSDEHMRTQVTAGEDYRVLEFGVECEQERNLLATQASEIKDQLRAYRDGAMALGGLNPADKAEIEKRQLRLEEISLARAELTQEWRQRRAAAAQAGRPEILVHRKMYPGTLITLRGAKRRVAHPVKGPVKIIENSGAIEFVSPKR